ncbi:MAG: histidine phosphatase family protein [Burkholderiales bacterium]|nr:histidine phosphatase family protein [Burkholderiales bacterium]
MEIYLIRHTRPGVPEGTCYGRTDVPLDEADFAQRVPAIADHLPAGMAFYSSPATRCARLAESLAARTGGALAALDARLHELHFGDWEGRLWRDLPRAETASWSADIAGVAPPNGESFGALWARVNAFYDATLAAALAAEVPRLAIVGHAGSLKVLVLRALRLAPADYMQADVAQGRVSCIDVRQTGAGAVRERLLFLNR